MKKKITNFLKKKFCFHDWIMIKNLSPSYLSQDYQVFFQCSKCGLYREREQDFGYGVDMDYINKYYYDDKRYLEIMMEELTK